MRQKIVQLHEQYGDIKIKCQGASMLPVDAILDFQKNLKKRTKKALLKLITVIFRQGFIAPFFVWDNNADFYLLDGHGRLDALQTIREAGVNLPGGFPVVWIQAENEQDAREKLLSITSQYGDFCEEALNEWLENMDQELAESIRLLDKEIDISEKKERGSPEYPDLQYNELLQIIVDVETQEDLKKLYDEMQERGFKCKLSTL